MYLSHLAGAPRGGIAIGDMILDLRAVHEEGLLDEEAQAAAHACIGPSLNPFLALGAGPRRCAARRGERACCRRALTNGRICWTVLRTASCICRRMSATTRISTPASTTPRPSGRQFRPDAPLPPNYKYVPIGYHGRASSLRPSGSEVRRPNGTAQARGRDGAELRPQPEPGLRAGARRCGSAPATPSAPPSRSPQAADHIAGYCLLNDWSARDIQGWEYQPLGPFLAKSFCTTVSAWIVTPEALAPFRAPQPPRPAGDPAPLPYLHDPVDQAVGALDLELEVLLTTRAMKKQGLAPHRLSIGSSLALYWTPAQLVAHHAGGGCNLNAGDLFGTGTISTAGTDGCGSLLEITGGGRAPITLPSGEERRFLEDGDEVVLRARAKREGAAPIGFGECRGVVLPTV